MAVIFANRDGSYQAVVSICGDTLRLDTRNLDEAVRYCVDVTERESGRKLKRDQITFYKATVNETWVRTPNLE